MRYLNAKEKDMKLTVMIVVVLPWVNIVIRVRMTTLLIRKRFDQFLWVEVSAYFVKLSKEVPAAPSF